MTASARELVMDRTLTQRDFDRFAALSGDDNPIHVDPAFSARTRFGRTVSHGLLLSTVLHGLADRLVPGCRFKSQELMFPAPTYADEPMRFGARLDDDNTDSVRIELWCVRIADGTVTCQGSAVLEAPDVDLRP